MTGSFDMTFPTARWFPEPGAPTTVVSGLPLTGDHPPHPFAIDSSGSSCS